LKIIFIIGIIVVVLFTVKNWKMNPSMNQIDGSDIITVGALKEKLKNEQPIMIDVRTPDEFVGKLGHIEGSFLIPLNELPQRLQELEKYKNEEIIMVCRSGNRSGQATVFLNNNDFNARNMVGGMIKWNMTK